MSVDWQTVFSPDMPIMETIVRGTVMYFALLILLRMSKRETSDIGLADVLVIVVLADAAQNGMAGEYNSISSGIILVGTIIFWSYIIDMISFHVPAIDRLFRPRTICLVRYGRMLYKNMRQEMLTEDELMEQLRIAGVDDVKKVRSAHMEANGKISVIKYKD